MTDDYTPSTDDVAEAWASRFDGEHTSASGDERRGYEAEFNPWLAAHDAAKRVEWEAEQGWEYVPGWIGDDDRPHVSAGTISPDYVGEYISEGGEVLRRRVANFETVTAAMAPVPDTESEGETHE